MTHVQSRTQDRAADLAARPDREEIMHLRRFADRALLPSVCPRDECRRAECCRVECCRGALIVPEFFGKCPLPFCQAQAFDGLFEPVVRWHEIMKTLDAVAAAGDAPAAERPKG